MSHHHTLGRSACADFAVIFDMDGVLIDSVGLNWQTLNQVLKPHQVEIKKDELRSYMGKSLRDQVRQMNQEFKLQLDYDQFEASATAVQAQLVAGLSPMPGAKKLLQHLALSQIPVAVATSNSKAKAEQRLRLP